MLIRVAAAQVALGRGSYNKALEGAKRLIEQAAKMSCQIVCLPEHWLLEYREEGYDAFHELAKTARDQHIFVITGANYVRVNPTNPSELRIRCTLIGPDGSFVGHQDKIHLFRGEKDVAFPGEVFEVLTTPLGKIGITICYDNVFPEAARSLALKGADLLFVPSRIVSEGTDPWILYLRTRALENRIPVVAPNVFHPPHYVGGSVIIDLNSLNRGGVVTPKVVASAGAGEALITADVDVDRARELRKERLADRRSGAYVQLDS